MPENDTKKAVLNSGQGAQIASSNNDEIGNELQADVAPSSGSWFRLDPNLTLAILVFVAAVLGLMMLQLEMVSRVKFWLMVGLFVWMVWKRSSFALACLFLVPASILIVRFLFLGDFGFRSGLNQIDALDITFTFLLFGFAGACFRFLETRKYCLGVLSKFGLGRGVLQKRKLRGSLRKEFPSLLGGRWWLIPVSIVSAIMLLEFFPFDYSVVQKYWVKPKPMRLIFLIGTLFLVWFLVRSLFMLIMRWKMDVDQAGVHTRAMIAKEFWREHRAIESRRAKAIQK